MNVYDFSVKDQEGKEVALSSYKGKVLLIVNTATECGFTPQYNALQTFFASHKDKDFEILDFPCNQFMAQAPGSDNDIHTACVRRFNITFKQFSKICVNGADTIPLYKYLKDNTKFKGFDDNHEITPILKDILGKTIPDYESTSDIKWNFTKFLIDKAGNIVERFEPTASLDDMFLKIENLL